MTVYQLFHTPIQELKPHQKSELRFVLEFWFKLKWANQYGKCYEIITKRKDEEINGKIFNFKSVTTIAYPGDTLYHHLPDECDYIINQKAYSFTPSVLKEEN